MRAAAAGDRECDRSTSNHSANKRLWVHGRGLYERDNVGLSAQRAKSFFRSPSVIEISERDRSEKLGYG
jgi:hypothetical protein